MRKLALLVLVVVVAIGVSFAGSAVADPLDPNAYTSLGTLNPAGNVTIDTDALTMTVSGGSTYTGVIQSQGAGNPEIAVFTFDDISISSSSLVSISGGRALSLLSHGDLSINSALDVSGLGYAPNSGPGAGLGYGTGDYAGGYGGTHAGVGGARGDGAPNLVLPYGDLTERLDFGSGGGHGRNNGGGGAGGGALEIGAVGSIQIGTEAGLTSLATLTANGVDAASPSVSDPTSYAGGSGSGGSIVVRAHDLSISNLAGITAAGGSGLKTTNHGATGGGGGGGGRVLIQTDILSADAIDNSAISVAGGNGGPGHPCCGNWPNGYSGESGAAAIETNEFLIAGGTTASIINGSIFGATLSLEHLNVEGDGLVSITNSDLSFDRLGGAGTISLLSSNLSIGSQGGDSTFSGSINGTGGITKVGGGTLHLTGINSTTGTTTVSGGSLIASGSALSGDYVNNSTLVLQEDAGSTYAGTVTGTGSVEKTGTGTLSIGGSLTHDSSTIISEGTLEVTSSGSIESLGALSLALNSRLENNGGIVNVSALSNSGTFVGGGRVRGTFSNQPAGEARLSAGESLLVEGLGSHSNAGLIDVVGGEIEFDGTLTNAASTGLIYGRNATMRFDGGLTNDGSLALSFGTSDIYGSIANQVTGNIVVSGLSSASFLGGVSNEGNIQTGAGSTSVFFGTVTGSGAFNGTGQILMEGGFEPGSSPAEVYFGGDLLLGVANTLTIELGGTTPGTEHDKLIIANVLSLAGVLDVELFGGYQPIDGDTFNIFDAASISGMFTQLLLPGLSTGLEWDTSSLQTAGVIQVIPEPSTALLLGLGLTALAVRRGE